MSRELRLISCPFHNGLQNVGMGCGASRLAEDHLLRAGIEEAGWSVTYEEVDPVDETRPEIARVTALLRRLADRVRIAASQGAFPLVLGTVAGLGGEGLGAIWFDTHADFDDPEENTSGFFDVMGLAMLTGRGWRALRETIPGHRPIPERKVILAAVQDLEPYQRQRLEQSTVRAIPGPIDAERFGEALSGLGSPGPR